MEAQNQQPIYTIGDAQPTYLDIQAEVGITKHMGGYAATDALHRLCHLEQAHRVLEIGCGIGVGPAYIAKRFDCQVTAVDISEKMLSWAQERARREGVLDQITFRKADVSKPSSSKVLSNASPSARRTFASYPSTTMASTRWLWNPSWPSWKTRKQLFAN